MASFHVIFVIALFLFLNTGIKCSLLIRSRCSPINVVNGKLKLRQTGNAVRVVCNPRYKLVHGNEIINCKRNGEWDSESPICAQPGCSIVEKIPHGTLNVLYSGAKLEVFCDLGYSVDGPNFIYCNKYLEWNEELRGCKENDQISFHCDFESSDERFCGWKNDVYNDVDWLADKMSFLFLLNRRHVPSGSTQYFSNNYISLDAGNYGPSTSGKLISPPLLPFKTKQRCLIFSYKVGYGNAYGPRLLKVSFGGIPHWQTSIGEGKVIIGLFKTNVTSNIIIEGKNCKAAIDNLLIADGDFNCAQQPYEEEVDSCHDNCGKISNGISCGCDWECHINNDCCPDLKIQCPFIKPLEDIARLYLHTTAAATYTIKPITIKSINVTVSSKIINESKALNDLAIETNPMNDRNITMSSMATNYVTQPIPTSNITYPTFPPTPLLTSTIKPITITVTISSTLTSTEDPILTNASNSNTSLLFSGSSTTPIHKQFMNISDMKIVNITSTTPKIVDKPSTATKIVLVNRNVSSTVVTNVSSSTAKYDMVNTTISYTKLINASDTNVRFELRNKTEATTPASIISSTTKPVTKNVIPFTTKSTNFSTNSQKLLIKSNTSTASEPLNDPFNTISKLRYSQKTKQNIVTTENKSTILDHIPTSTPHIVENLDLTNIFKHKMVIVDTVHPNSNLIHSKYSTISENGKVLLNDNNFLNATITPLNFSEQNVLRKVQSTKIEISYEKPEGNNSLHSQYTINESKQMTEYVKQNENSKSSGILVDIVSATKYIAVIGVILITFKFTLSFVKWYFKKPTRDEMNACFIDTDKESGYNMELVSST